MAAAFHVFATGELMRRIHRSAVTVRVSDEKMLRAMIRTGEITLGLNRQGQMQFKWQMPKAKEAKSAARGVSGSQGAE